MYMRVADLHERAALFAIGRWTLGAPLTGALPLLPVFAQRLAQRSDNACKQVGAIIIRQLQAFVEIHTRYQAKVAVHVNLSGVERVLHMTRRPAPREQSAVALCYEYEDVLHPHNRECRHTSASG